MKREVLACRASDCPLFLFRRPKAEIILEMDKNPELFPHDSKGYPKHTPSPMMQHLGYRDHSFATIDRSWAIKRFCRECMCLTPKESYDPVKNCPSKKCWLYPHRMGKVQLDEKGGE